MGTPSIDVPDVEMGIVTGVEHSVCLPVCLSVCLSACLSGCLSVCLTIHPSACRTDFHCSTFYL